MDEGRELGPEEVSEIERAAFEWWGISPDTLDVVEAYGAMRILRIKADKPALTFDDFAVAWKKMKQ